MKWRLLVDDAVGHDQGLSVDDGLAQSATQRKGVTLRLYTYRPCVLVGRFQNVADEVNIERCNEIQIPINRRPTGGGSIIMGPDQLGIALVVPQGIERFSANSSTLMSECARGIIKALEILGIHAKFHGKNDLVVGTRKIAGLGLYHARGGGTLFHASLLLDIDVQFMVEVLRTPFEKSVDNGFEIISERISSICSEIGSTLSMPHLVDIVKAGYEEEFSAVLKSATMDEEERTMTEQLYKQRYSTNQWVFEEASRVRDSVGRNRVHTAGGTLDVRAIVAGQMVKSVFFNGDFITSDNAIFDLEGSLRWHVRDFDVVFNTIHKSFERNCEAWNQVSVVDIANAVMGAIDQSDLGLTAESPGTCFARGSVEIV